MTPEKIIGIAARIENANLTGTKALPVVRIIDCLILRQKNRLDTGASKTFQPLRYGLISITVIASDCFEFKKRGQLFVGTNDEPLSIIAVRVCCEKHAASRINLR